MLTDRYGYELSTRSSAAAEHWVDGADRFLAADGGSLEAFERAIAMDGDFALAHAGRARVLALRGAGTEARSEATRAVTLASGATSRERSHVEVIHNVAYGDSAGALARIHAHVKLYPRDAFALQPATNVFGLIGLSGRPDREREVFDLLASLAGDYGDDWWYVGTLGFWHTELGRIDDGLRLNRQSLEANPRNGNAVHGLAHAWYEAGDDDAGIDFLELFLARYPRDGALHCHLSWHLALFALRGGNAELMWTVFTDGIKPGASTTAPPLNTATDSVALLWHAQLFGYSVNPSQWADARAFIGEHFPAPANGFLEVHRAIACAMAGDSSAVDSIVKGMRDADATGRFPWGTVMPDAIEGMAAFARGDDPRAIELLLPRIDEYVRIGGSHAQRDLFQHTLVAAYLRDGRLDEARNIAQRTPWRVDRGAHALIVHHAKGEQGSDPAF